MSPELVALAWGAASSLVSAMTSDAWAEVKHRVAKLLGRGEPSVEAGVLETLDEDAAALSESAVQVQDLSSQWTARLRDLLRADPGAAAELRQLAAELAMLGGTSLSGHGVIAGGDVTVRADGGAVAAVTIEGGVQIGNPTRPGTEKG